MHSYKNFFIYIDMTYSNIVYMVLDELKLLSDDATFNEEHVIFLANKYRIFLLKQRYSDVRKEIPSSNFQTICIDLEKYSADNNPCTPTYLRSTQKIPSTLDIGTPKIYPMDMFAGLNISYVSFDRFKAVGHNKYLKNIIYATEGEDDYLYLNSANPQFSYLKKIQMTGIFENAEDAVELQCNKEDKACDILDLEFPLESALVPTLIELIVKELSGAKYQLHDDENNAHDDSAVNPPKK